MGELNKGFIFSSERLNYREMREQDAPLVSAWRSNPDNYVYFFSQRPTSLEEHLAWFMAYLADDTKISFMVFDGDGRAIGTGALTDISKESCEISYMIGDKSSRGKGYGAETVRALSRFAFDILNVNEIYARIMPKNIASIRTIRRGGFSEYEHVFRLCRSDTKNER